MTNESKSADRVDTDELRRDASVFDRTNTYPWVADQLNLAADEIDAARAAAPAPTPEGHEWETGQRAQVGDRPVKVREVLGSGSAWVRDESAGESNGRLARVPLSWLTYVPPPVPPLTVGDTITKDTPEPPIGTVIADQHNAVLWAGRNIWSAQRIWMARRGATVLRVGTGEA